MKKNILFILLRASFILLFLAIVQTLFCQTEVTPQENPFSSSDKAFSWYTAVYSAAITLLTYVQAWLFPNAGKGPTTVLRWVIIAAVVGGIFISLGLTNGLGVFLGFIGSALTYDKVLQPLGLSTTKTK